MTWHGYVIIVLAIIAIITNWLTNQCFDDDDEDMDPWNSYK